MGPLILRADTSSFSIRYNISSVSTDIDQVLRTPSVSASATPKRTLTRIASGMSVNRGRILIRPIVCPPCSTASGVTSKSCRAPSLSTVTWTALPGLLLIVSTSRSHDGTGSPLTSTRRSPIFIPARAAGPGSMAPITGNGSGKKPINPMPRSSSDALTSCTGRFDKSSCRDSTFPCASRTSTFTRARSSAR